MSVREVLLVFARYPTPGRTKTRLAKRLGDAGAVRLYDAFVRDLVARFCSAPFEVRWVIAPPDPGFGSRYGVASRDCAIQTGEDLGARMGGALAAELTGAATRCVLVGSDMPQLSVARVREAFSALQETDLVLGPARDGGYYLIGMNEPCDVFSGMTWSVDSVLAQTQHRAKDLGLRVALLDEDFDVDEVGDLDRLRERLALEPLSCPATRTVLEELAHR